MLLNVMLCPAHKIQDRLASEGRPLADTLRATRLRMQGLFGNVPLAMIDAVDVEVFAQHAADLEAGSEGKP
jgi:hypothetical protein